jgi:hypothetical protein
MSHFPWRHPCVARQLDVRHESMARFSDTVERIVPGADLSPAQRYASGLGPVIHQAATFGVAQRTMHVYGDSAESQPVRRNQLQQADEN